MMSTDIKAVKIPTRVPLDIHPRQLLRFRLSSQLQSIDSRMMISFIKKV